MLEITPLAEDDVEEALALSTQAGWNQLKEDWLRLVRLWPGGCFAGREAGQMVATATLASYGSALGWVGMVLVDERCRGRGYGGAIFDTAMGEAEARGIGCVGLDATDLGEPVYRKRGFEAVLGINRWRRPAGEMAYRTRRMRGMGWVRWISIGRLRVTVRRWGLTAGVC